MFSLLATLVTLVSAGADSSSAPTDSIVPLNKSVVAAPIATAPTSTFDRYGRWQFGISGGESSGGGLAVRYWFNEKNALEVHGFGYLYKREMPGDNSTFINNYGYDDYYYGNDTGTVSAGKLSLGIQYLHEVLRLHLFDANGLIKGPSHLRGLTFVGIGGSAKYEDRDLRNGSYGTYSGWDQSYYTNKLKHHSDVRHMFGGTGGGIEFEISRFSAHLLLGLGGEYALTSESYGFGPTVDGGIFVRF